MRKRPTKTVFRSFMVSAILVPEDIHMPAPDDRRTKMLELARRWRDSGVKARVFAQEQGITPWTLYYWRQRLASQDRPTRQRRRSRRATLAPVHVVVGARD